MTLEISELIKFLRQELHDLPDARKPGNNTKYQREDAVLGAFSVFFTQSPSFLEHQRLMKSSKGKDNASSLFSLNEIPCDNQIRNLLDPVPASKISGAFQRVYQWLKKQGVLKKYGNPITLLGDDLYSHQPICELALEKGYNFIFVCLQTSHKTLYEWLEFLEKTGEVKTVEKKQWNGRKNLIYRYRYVSRVPLRDGDDSLEVNWCEVTVIDEKTQKTIYQNNWITNHQITENNVDKIVKAGRSRWKIENEGNNILKNHGYNLEHNFGHGQENLCEFLLSLNLLAFLFHTVLDLVNSTYQKIRELLVTRSTFFNDIRTLLKYFWFKDWSDLFLFILTENVPLKQVNSS